MVYYPALLDVGQVGWIYPALRHACLHVVRLRAHWSATLGRVLSGVASVSDSLFPLLGDMQTLAGWFALWVAYGVGLSIVFWTLGYLVWFIVQFFK